MIKELTYKPTVFWAWNSNMTKEEITRDLTLFKEQNIGGVFVHARAGLKIEYLGEDWFNAFQITIDLCKSLGIEVWIYDEQGWPSGFAGGIVAAFGEDYLIKHLQLTNNKEEVDFKRLVASYKIQNDTWILTDFDHATWFIYYKIQPPYVDLLNPNVTKKFIEVTHEVYKKHFGHEFGKTIKGVFTDEPQIHVTSLAWSIAIKDTFLEINNYDYLQKLPLLFEEENDDAKSYRYDYYKVVRHLFVNNYTKVLNEWARDNNLILTGHFAGEEGLCIQVASNTGVMPHYEHMDMAGIDSLGRRLNAVLLMKQIESVTSQWNRHRVISETFACTGNGVSFKELKTFWGYHLSFGVNYPCMSISMTDLSGIRKRDYPIFISRQQPWWQHFRYHAEWMEKANELTNIGTYKSDVLVISSVNSALYEKIFSLQQKIVSSNYRKLIEYLVDLQIPFDIGDETLIKEHGKVENGLFKINHGSYKMIILPEQTGINESTLLLLEEFKRQGGKIIQIERFPTLLDGKVSTLPHEILSKIVDDVLQDRKGIIEKYWLKNRLERPIHIRDVYGKTEHDLIIRNRYDQDKIHFSVFNKSTHQINSFVEIQKEGLIYEVDILTNEKSLINEFCNQSNTIGKLVIDGGEFKVFEFVPNKKQEKVESLKSITNLDFAFNSFTHPNLLVLDTATYQTPIETITTSIPVVKILDRLYKLAEDNGEKIDTWVHYRFANSSSASLNLSLEMEGCVEIRINEESLWKKGDQVPTKYYMDECIKTFELDSKIIGKDNIISIHYVIVPMNLGYDIEEMHDSIRNKFSYPVHIEAIYITGEFDIQANGSITEDQKAITSKGPFTIINPISKHNGDINKQNRFFYTGNLVYEIPIDYDKGLMYIKPFYKGIGAVIYLNDKEISYVDDQKEIRIDQYLTKGNQKLTIHILGSLRNMMGPFHHISKEPEFTGVHTFTGDYGNGAVEDLSSDGITENIWTYSYHTMRQGLYKIQCIKVEN